jgi:cell division protein FtsW (lipid II flippase)
MIVLRLCGGPIVYASLLAMILGTAYGGFMLYQNSLGLSEADKNKKYYLYGSYAVWGLAGLLLFYVCCNLKNIRIGVAVMKCTAAFIGSNPQVFLVPPVFIVLLMGWFGVWCYIAASIMSIGKL